ncbi:hypothetical protein AMK59_2085 [Oryctes borbonicus]|uniref:G-protein coupled receptors family 1 profile domain-containing protein n=1 Tax=Oryctes borbonicus TaxID=1629725 RepID=A0A0T6BCK0_9SCAR|nr:hypothetical protein AMK59_2085 [Oryctes borbonicus]
MSPLRNEEIPDHRDLIEWSLASNESNITNNLPLDMRFNDGHVLSIVVYSVLMVFSAIGNITILVLIIRRRKKAPSRITTTLMHLAIADLLVSMSIRMRSCRNPQ